MAFETFHDQERAGWDARAPLYDDATARAALQAIPALLAAVRLKPGDRLLDVGCGPGYAAGAAHALNARVEGIDFAPAMIDAARRRFPGLAFSLGEACALPADDATFDVVVSSIVLFHVPDPARAIAEAFRVLKPGGRYACSQWCAPKDSDLYRILFDAIGPRADMSGVADAPDAFAISDHDVAAAMMRGAGFDQIEVTEAASVVFTSEDRFSDFCRRFGVRVPLILDQQTPAVCDEINREIDAAIEAYRVDGVISVPMPSLVVSGRKP